MTASLEGGDDFFICAALVAPWPSGVALETFALGADPQAWALVASAFAVSGHGARAHAASRVAAKGRDNLNWML
jgi:hypothetical protein